MNVKNIDTKIWSSWIIQDKMHDDIVDVIQNTTIFNNVKKRVLPHEFLIFLMRCLQKAKIIQGSVKNLIIPKVLNYRDIITIENKVRKIFIEEYKKLNAI